jgi:threonine dehydratase
MSTTTGPVTLADVLAAQAVLDGVVRVTPLEGSRPLSDRVGGPVYLKCENLQRAGSFKIRGAYLRISRLTEEQRRHGVVAASAGNHAQGVALAASLLGTTATVFMPSGAPLPKLEATRAYGAHIRMAGHTVDEALVEASAYAEQTGAVLIHPFDHPDIVAGQGTIGLEIVEQCPDVRTVVVCTGGGGLLAGTAVAVRSLRPDAKIVGVQAEGAAAYPPSLAAGRPVPLPGMATMADGIAVGRPGDLPFALVCDHVDDVVTVSEESLSRALLLCLERAKLVVEPAGAAAVAAVMDRPWEFEPPVVVVLSGGNIDPLLMLRVLRHGLAAAGRYQAVHVRMPDRPGALAGLLSTLAETDANVLDVVHTRVDPRLRLDEVDVSVQIETRGTEHLDEVMARLRGVGYVVTSG